MTKCDVCGSSGAYVGFNKTECIKFGCANFTERRHEEYYEERFGKTSSDPDETPTWTFTPIEDARINAVWLEVIGIYSQIRGCELVPHVLGIKGTTLVCEYYDAIFNDIRDIRVDLPLPSIPLSQLKDRMLSMLIGGSQWDRCLSNRNPPDNLNSSVQEPVPAKVSEIVGFQAFPTPTAAALGPKQCQLSLFLPEDAHPSGTVYSTDPAELNIFGKESVPGEQASDRSPRTTPLLPPPMVGLPQRQWIQRLHYLVTTAYRLRDPVAIVSVDASPMAVIFSRKISIDSAMFPEIEKNLGVLPTLALDIADILWTRSARIYTPEDIKRLVLRANFLQGHSGVLPRLDLH